MAQSRQYMGGYTSDNYTTKGLGLTGAPGTYSVVAELPVEDFAAYDGGKVVGMRFALAQAATTSKCFILTVKGDKIDTLAVAPISSSNVGWNEVSFAKPATFDFSAYESLLIGYEYEQTSSNYPLSMVDEGTIYESYVYGNLGYGTTYNNVGLSDYGNLSAQALVEKDFLKVGASAADFAEQYIGIGQVAQVNISLINCGTDAVSSVDYTVSRNGVSGAEQHVAISPSVSGLASSFEVTVPIKAADKVGTEDVVVTITKVNGAANPVSGNKAEGKLTTVSKFFKHRVAVEEFTGTGCPWCPRGMQGMENLRESFGDSFIGIALHQYSSSTRDAMAISSANYKNVSFSGAPSCRIERGEEMDPYYGSNSDGICNDFKKVLDKITPVGVEVSANWNADQTSVTAYATVEALSSENTYDIEYVLVADELTGYTTAWKQANNYSQYSAAQLPTDLQQFGSGGKYGTSNFSGWKFNDVAIGSSYQYSKNTAESLGQLTAGVPVKSECTVKMPTNKNLLSAIKYDKVYIVALVVNKATGQIVNAAKNNIDAYVTGVEDVEAPATIETSPVMINMAGQRVGHGYRGIVIKNGKKYLQK